MDLGEYPKKQLNMKLCYTCKIKKAFTEFSKNKTKPDGLQTKCKSCKKEYSKKWYLDNKDHVTEYVKKYREENKEKVRTSQKKYKDTHKEEMKEWRINFTPRRKEYEKKNHKRIKERTKKYQKDNKEYIGKRAAIWRENHRDYLRECSKIWSKNNPDKVRKNSAKRRTEKLKRCPNWVNEIELAQVYQNCPKGYHVDHIIPLQGKDISGLHVPWNLQYLTPEENGIKRARFDGTYDNDGWKNGY